MKNTLENEMLDAAVSWCCSNGINVLEPEQLASLVNSLYVTVCDATLDTAQQAQPERAPSVPVLTDDELAAFLRFDETTADDQSYDIEKSMMRRLSEIGLVCRKFGAYYQTTEYGMAVLSAAHGITASPETT